MKRRLSFASMVILTVGLGVLPVRATTSPVRTGQIAFTRYRLQDAPIWSEIYVANPDGSGVRKVSHSATAAEDDQAQWSPDGSWIVFDRCIGKRPCSLWIVRPDGSGQRRLSAACPSHRPPPVCSNDSSPAFTPDGQRVVFAHDWGHIRRAHGADQIEHSAIATVDLQGGHLTILRQLAPYAGDVQAPRISPDGKLVVFDRSTSPLGPHPAGADALIVAPLTPGPTRRITPWRLSAGSPSWSPDGKQILFKQFIPGVSELTPGTNLYTIRADGTNRHQVTNVGASHYVLAGSFSPDSSSIVFATDANAVADPRGGTFADVFTLRLGDTSPTAVTHTANLDGWPSWGAAG